MPKAIVDPEELRRFALELEHTNTAIQSQLLALQARYKRLSDTWKDQEQAKFSEVFEQTLRMLARFTEVSAQHIPYLLRKAQRADDYLHQR
jgi:uncharacterized protein YukE